MAKKDWKTKRNRNPYVPYSWINTKKGLLLEIHYDIGFGEQRNVTIYNYKNQLLSGFEEIKTFYCRDTKEAKEKAIEYMRYN